MAAPRPAIGDLVRIPLGDGRSGYAQYVHFDPDNGPLLQVLDVVSRVPPEIDELVSAKPMFPPVITGLFHAVRSGRWERIGKTPVRLFKYPMFVMQAGSEGMEPQQWWLWDGRKERRLPPGALPSQYRTLEILQVWPPEALEERIRTGASPFQSYD